MDPLKREQRLEQLRTMIHELANGNFSHRIPLGNQSDDIESFGLMLNLLAEELGSFFVHPGSFGERDIEDPYSLILDTDLNITAVNSVFLKLLNHPKETTIGQPIKQFLYSSSFHNLKKQFKNPYKRKKKPLVVKLLITLTPHNSLPIDCWGYCHILHTRETSLYFIRGLPIVIHSPQSVHTTSTAHPSFRSDTVLQYQADIQKIRAVHQYILEHLHESLPNTLALSRLFHMNENKLKKGFKELYQITIFKLHLEKRLDQAMVMVKNTPTSLKVIAYSLGFKSFPHFSKVFKDKFEYPPSHFRNR